MALLDTEFPFKSVLSFKRLIVFWQDLLNKGGPVETAISKTVEAALKDAPELFEPITDPSILLKHRDMVDMLMSLVFPPAFRDRDYAAAFVPFQTEIIYATPNFQRIWPGADCMDMGILANLSAEEWAMGRLVKAYALILQNFYQMDLPLDFPLIITTPDPDTGLERYLSITFDPRFVEVKNTGPLKPLSESEKERLLAVGNQPNLWMEIIPPDPFLFEGFGVCRAVDVTDQEVLSYLKRDLIEKESIFSGEGFQRLHEKLRIYLRNPDLMVDLAAFQGDQVLILNPEHKMETGCIFCDSEHRTKKEFEGSLFAGVVERRENVMIRDLTRYPVRTDLENHLIEKGIRSLFVAPLQYRGQMLGTFSLKSPNPGAFSVLDVMKLKEITPLFAMALNRGMEELNNRVQAIIKEKCTAIHPTVEWRFQRAALNYLQRGECAACELEPIVFRDVYPLYGASDIRDSSDQRNAALQSDLVDQLQMVREILELAREEDPLPILAALIHRIDRNIEEVQTHLHSGDESTKAEFIRREIEPVLDHFLTSGSKVRARVLAYRSELDPAMGTLYRKRRDFEQTVMDINDAISQYLDEEEETAQSFFPHYFEKMKTDGVDHTIYIGASMVENRPFDPIYLKNLRLWQFMVMCGVVWRTAQVKTNSRIPLETAHLILVQDTPMSIRFRPDERRFDVDGAYDIRHEIIKKRIDKAVVQEGKERLTQPGKIAIVYSHRREMHEYLKYVDYLQDEGYLEPTVEQLELEDLQGVSGLRALRVTVDRNAAMNRPFVAPEVVRNAVKSL